MSKLPTVDESQKSDSEEPTPGWTVEGVDEDSQTKKRASGTPPYRRRPFWLGIALLLAVNWMIATLVMGTDKGLDLPYSAFLDQVEASNVAEVTGAGQTISGELRSPIRFPVDDPDAATGSTFETERPTFATQENLVEVLREAGVEINAETLQAPLWQIFVFSVGPTLLLVGLFIMVFRRFGGAMGGLGRSKAKRYDAGEASRVTFADVAGIDEAKAELTELVDFLRRPEKYARLGGQIPRGVLLSGPPGTGKTLLARAVAGEADVPFFSSSASEFIEMVVGVGASRVRNLFEEALKLAPSIIFIDELDAIGRSRSSSPSGGGGSDEREQTLNQILTEMDGFSGSEGVIVLAATNRPEILDSALLRPGRFDRQVVVNPPDQAGRKEILAIHTKSVPLASDVDLGSLASSTVGMVGAELRNLVNEGALLAARADHDQVTMGDLQNAMEKVLLGVARNIAIDEDERRRTAYHEAGHALLGMLSPGADPVRKISIIPRGRALGVTISAPDSDRHGYDVAFFHSRMKMLLAGRAAEELIFGTVTTGALSDLEKTTEIARSMVGRWGMNERIGLVTVLPSGDDDGPFGPRRLVSEHTMRIIDDEVRALVEQCYESAKETLVRHRVRLDDLADALLEHETLDEDAAYAAAGIDRHEKITEEPPAPTRALTPASALSPHAMN